MDHLITGVSKLTARQIADILDQLGAEIKVRSGREADPRTSMLSDRGVAFRDAAEKLDEVIEVLDHIDKITPARAGAEVR